MKAKRGFTLLELMVTIAVLGVVVAMSIPSFNSLAEKWRVKGAAEYVYEQLMFARTEAVKRSRPIIVSFGADNTATWALGITSRNEADACDPGETSIDAADACTIDYDNDPATDDPVLYRFTSLAFTDVRMKGEDGNAPAFATDVVGDCIESGNSAQTCFDPVRGMARPGTVVVGTDRHEAWIVVGIMGRARICAPDNEQGIGDYPPCEED
jgi:prepilin-type N-terminal cleavage/methylation domain-containing protein